MPANTPVFSLPYPVATDPLMNGAAAIQALAERVEALLAPMVTSLPGSPVNGQECILVDSLTAPTYAWRLRYVAARSSNKWVAVGATPAQSVVDTAQSCSAIGSYGDASTLGPDFTIPVAGDYLIQVSVHMGGSTGLTYYASYAVGATAANDEWAQVQYQSGAGLANAGSRVYRWLGLAAGTLIRVRYRIQSGGSGTVTVARRTLVVTPIALGG